MGPRISHVPKQNNEIDADCKAFLKVSQRQTFSDLLIALYIEVNSRRECLSQFSLLLRWFVYT